MKTALTIAGSDCSGGAGIQADLKTFAANGVYGMSAITALTAQNTLGVISVLTVEPSFLEDQLAAIFEDIPPDAVKIGMVSSVPLIESVARALKKYKVKKLVLDPVMVTTSGTRLLEREAVSCLAESLFPLASVVTPNRPETELLTGLNINTQTDMREAALTLSRRYGTSFLIKGGHGVQDADDIWADNGKVHLFKGRRIDNFNTHGTGCTLSSAIAANLAKDYDMLSAIRIAKDYLSAALADGMNLGKGSGPLNHIFPGVNSFMERSGQKGDIKNE